MQLKNDNEKKIITNMVDFLNKLEFDHREMYVNKTNKTQKQTIEVTSNDVKKIDSEKGGFSSGKSYINNNVRNLDTDYYHKLPFL